MYVLQRVTFGDKPSPEMASFVMLKMAKENQEKLRLPFSVETDKWMT